MKKKTKTVKISDEMLPSLAMTILMSRIERLFSIVLYDGQLVIRSGFNGDKALKYRVEEIDSIDKLIDSIDELIDSIDKALPQILDGVTLTYKVKHINT